MRLVERPVMRPMHCAAIPTRGQTAVDERWVDTGSELPGFDNHIYLSETAIREAGRLLGFATPREVGAIAEEKEKLQAQLDEANAKIAYLEDVILSTSVAERYLDTLTQPEAKTEPVSEGKGK